MNKTEAKEYLEKQNKTISFVEKFLLLEYRYRDSDYGESIFVFRVKNSLLTFRFSPSQIEYLYNTHNKQK